jgi:hypothetical protein
MYKTNSANGGEEENCDVDEIINDEKGEPIENTQCYKNQLFSFPLFYSYQCYHSSSV